jgi:hypothetical protein
MRQLVRWTAVAASAIALTVACGGGDGGNGPGGGGGGSTAFTAKIDGVSWATDDARLQIIPGSTGVPGSLIITGTKVTGTSSTSIQLILGYVNFPANYPLGVNYVSTPGGSGSVIETIPPNSEIRSTPLDGESGLLVLVSNDGTHIKGTFTFVAQPLLGSSLVGNRTITEGTFDFDLPAGYVKPGLVNFGSDMMADLNGDHFYGATALTLGGNGVFSIGGTTTTLSVSILNSTLVTAPTTLNLLSGVRISVLDFTNGHSWGGISGDVGSVHYSGVGARVNGEFSGTLQPNTGSGATGTLTITGGSFNMRVDAP